MVLHGRGVQTVGANVRVVDSCAHGDRLVEVRMLAKHRAKLESLIVVCVLFATGCGPRVDLLGSNTRQIGDRRSAAIGCRSATLVAELKPAATVAMTGRCSGILKLQVVQVGLHM